jgi:hypothetical protein
MAGVIIFGRMYVSPTEMRRQQYGLVIRDFRAPPNICASESPQKGEAGQSQQEAMLVMTGQPMDQEFAADLAPHRRNGCCKADAS